MSLEQVIVLLIVAGAVTLSILLLSRRMTGNSGCGCRQSTCTPSDTCMPPKDEPADQNAEENSTPDESQTG